MWSAEQLAPPEIDEVGRHDRGIYFATKRENKSKEMFTIQLDSSQELKKMKDGEHTTSQHELDSPCAAKESIETVAAAFRAEAGEIDRQLDEMTKSLQLSHLHADQDEAEVKARQKQEAFKREHEAALRKARQKEKAARDPHRKIEIRLENKRRFEMDKLDNAGIPVTRIDFQGQAGREQYSLVDVRALRCKCQGLLEGVRTVPELVELQQQKEKAARNHNMSASATGSTMSNMPVFSLPSTYSDDSCLPSQMSWEDKSEKARMYRQCLLSEHVVYKLNLMKNPPERIPHSFDVFEYCAPDTRGDWELSELGTIRRKGEVSIDSATVGGALEDTNVGKHRSNGDDSARAAKRKAQLGNALHKATAFKAKKEAPEKKVSNTVLLRVKHLWRCFRGVVRSLTVYFAHMRRIRSAEKLRKFVRQLGEWSRIKTAIRKLVATVNILQRTCKHFLTTKGKRCELMQREFQKAEDIYLQSFFRLYAHRALEEHYQKEEDANTWVGSSGKHIFRSPHKKRTHKMTHEESNQFVDQTFDWKSYRIPVNVRKSLISRYYLFELSKHLRGREDLLWTVNHTVQFQKDLLKTMEYFGVGENAKHKQWSYPTLTGKELMMPEFWHLTEDMVIDLVCMAAESLGTSKDPNHAKFKEHPANKSDKLMEDEYDKFCRPLRPLPNETRAALAVGLEHRMVTRQDLVKAEVNLAVKRASIASAKEVAHAAGRRRSISDLNSPEQSVTIVDETPVDLDDVCRDFTPRLKEMVQEQLAAEG